MIRTITIENFKSIEKLELELGRINVFIGENGSGKSNVLEAIAFASAASQDKLDNEFLASRGIRVTEPRFMRAAFTPDQPAREIHLAIDADGDVRFEHKLQSAGSSTHLRWVDLAARPVPREFVEAVTQTLRETFPEIGSFSAREPASEGLTDIVLTFADGRQRVLQVKANPAKEPTGPHTKPHYRVTSDLTEDRFIRDFLIYSPENTALRIFQAEGQILPLGIKGEGLFAHLKALTAEPERPRLNELMERLSLIDWFERFEIPEDLAPGERSLRIRDRYLSEGAFFDQRSANEGFLFLLFYFTLFISPDTPSFFAIDNVDASLNPKLCSALTEGLVELAKKHDKQAILTTHNPAVLDGLDLHDEEQRLLVVSRNKSGHTLVRRVLPPKPIEGEPPIRLSEAFLRGYIGGLPKNF